MTRIGDFSNRAGFQPTTSFSPTAQAAPPLKHPVLAQIFSALEQRCSPATRHLLETKLAHLPAPIRQALTATLRKLVQEIHQQSQTTGNRAMPSMPPAPRHVPNQFRARQEISIEEILRNNGYPMPHNSAAAPGPRPSSSSRPNTARAAYEPTGSSPDPNNASADIPSPKVHHTAAASAASQQKPRLSMQGRPGAAHIQQLRASGMSDSDLMTLKDDIRAIRESGGSTKKQEDFDKKYAHVFNSTNEGGIRDNEKNYAVLWMLITKEVRNTA